MRYGMMILKDILTKFGANVKVNVIAPTGIMFYYSYEDFNDKTCPRVVSRLLMYPVIALRFDDQGMFQIIL